MKVFNSFAEAEGIVKGAVVAIGMFDGVHKGHKTIISHLRQTANKVGGESTLITFWPHPRQVLSNNQANLKLINTLEEKIGLLSQTGVQNLIVHPFTIEFSKTSGYDFLQNYLAKTLNAKAVVVGKNHFFGHNREGNFKQIAEFAESFSIIAKQIPLKLIDKEAISSASIREALSLGNTSKANQLLGYKYFVTGNISGSTQSRRFLFITDQQIKLLPTRGVYICSLKNRDEEINCTAEISAQSNGADEIVVMFEHKRKLNPSVQQTLTFF